MSRTLDVKPAHNDDDPDFASIHEQMSRPDLRSLHLDHMYRLDASPPGNLASAPYFSPVTALAITSAGAPAPALATLLSWPRSLHNLQILSSLDYDNGMNRYARGAGNFSISGFMQALAPQKEYLEHITYRATYDHVNAHAHDGVADFSGFKKLRSLDLPLDLVWEESWDDDPELNDDDWTPVDLPKVLPSGLQELVLDVASSGHGFFWYDGGEGASDELRESKAARELFDWLATVPRAKASGSALGGLRSVKINLEDGNPPRGPLDCEHTRGVRLAFEKAGMALTWSHEEVSAFLGSVA